MDRDWVVQGIWGGWDLRGGVGEGAWDDRERGCATVTSLGVLPPSQAPSPNRMPHS